MKATWGDWYWPSALIAIGVIIFGPETWALATNVRNTLSWWVWRVLNVAVNRPIGDWNAAHFLIFGLWLLAMAFLTWHLFFRRFT